jgi:hypothetical protein
VIWQVPVIKIDMADYPDKVEDPYGTYTVNIYAYHHAYLDHNDSGSCTFILDAIRIYNPAKGNEEAEDAYKADKEYNPNFTILKTILLSADNLAGENTINGVVFVDGKSETSIAVDYANPGPNNETYLAYKQGVSFKLTAEEIPATVQIGAMLAFGEAATLTMNGENFVTLNTATDMYYVMLTEDDWTMNEDGLYVTDTITLANVTDDAVISLTNLKFTHTSDTTPEVTAVVDDEVIEVAGAIMFALFHDSTAEEDENEDDATVDTDIKIETEDDATVDTDIEIETEDEKPVKCHKPNKGHARKSNGHAGSFGRHFPCDLRD